MAKDGSIDNDFQFTASYNSLSLTRGSHYETAKEESHKLNILDRKKPQESTEATPLTVSHLTLSLIEKESLDRQASAILAGWNVTNMIQGMGILGVPYAVREGGVAAVVCIFIVAMFCDFTGILLVDCLYEISPRSKMRKRVRESYPDVGDAVWPGVGGKVVGIVQTIELYSAAVLYLILLTSMLSQITAKYVPIGLNEWAIICSLAVLPSVFIQRLSRIAWMSMVAVFSLMSALMVMISYCIVLSDEWTWDNIPSFNISTFPVGFGIVAFSYCAHAVFPGVEGSMREPKHFNNMMHVSFFISAVVKTLFGIFSVLTFGHLTKQVFTLNLEGNVVFNTAATVLVAINVFFSFPVPLFVVVETFDNIIGPHFPHLAPGTKYHWYWLLLTRTLLVTLALFIALVVPHFGLLMGFVGSFTGTCLSFGFPCIAHLMLRWNSLRWYHITGEIVLIVFGVFAGGLSFVYSGKALLDSFHTFK
ncbi:vesicular inhibitory amino acid transporter-like [Montipora capricornis]|uniref:vesicular inhibitory amino acid transporter-like n=1 Tax=Montipora capricornis TaxID=246305 RepID=UPI0035F13783